MNKKTILSVSLLLGVFYCKAQVGSVFPELKGITLNDKEVSLPVKTKGKTTLVCLAYSKKAEEDLQTWLNPSFNKFILKTGMMDEVYDVNLLFIPMFTGVNQPTESMAKKQLKEGTNRKFFDNIVCYHGSMKEYKDVLHLNEKDKPYFFVLDKTGKIVYATSGVYSEAKMEEIEDKIE